LVGIGEQLVTIEVLEDFIESVLSTTLETVADKRWRPSEEDTTKTLSSVNGLPRSNVGCVELGIDLATTFYQIKGSDGSMGWSTSYSKSELIFKSFLIG
jgi:hypothetical protein